MFDGSIQGAPNPAGHQDYFRFDFADLRGCCSDDLSPVYTGYQYGYGMSLDAYNGSVGAQIPRNATQWTDNTECINKPAFGALIAYANTGQFDSAAFPPNPAGCSLPSGFQTDGAFWAIKWAEIGETYQSINFARPAGKDKFSLDETQPVYCYDGTTLTLASDGATAASVSQTGTWGGPSVGGFFDGFSTDADGALSLGTQLFNAPSDRAGNSGDSDIVFGKLRFPSAPSLLGRIPIEAITDSNGNEPFSDAGDPGQLPGGSPVDWIPTYHMSPAQTAFGMGWSGGSYTAHEQVDIFDAAMSAVASNVTATRLADDTFTLSTAYSTAAWVIIHGAAAYQYCDNYPKGDYIYLEWLHEWRTNGEYTRLNGILDCSGAQLSQPTLNNSYASFSQTQAALPIIKCQPRVVCFSPNAENWPNGNTYAFPETFVADETYGSKWQAQVLWSITDPFWQAPHRPCGLGDADPVPAWVMDGNGSCPDDDDTHSYYGLAPMVEARLTVPSGFPSLPSGMDLGFLSPVDHTSGDVAFPSGIAGFFTDGRPLPVVTPWSLAINLCNTVNTGCRFNYSDWVIGCPPTSA